MLTRKMKDSGIEWIGEIPEDWEVKLVKHEFYRKKNTPTSMDFNILSLARSGIKIRDISTGEGQIAQDYSNYNPVSPGDLLLNPMDLISGDNCNISYVTGVISQAYFNLGTIDSANPYYFNYYFKLQYWLGAFFAHGKGVSFENRWTINNDTLMNYPITFPTIKEQCRIVSKLDFLTEKISDLKQQTQQSIEELKKYKQSLITEAVTKGLDPNVEMKDSGIEWIGEIPKHWEITRPNIISSIVRGNSGFQKSDMKQNGDYVAVQYGQVYKLDILDENYHSYVDKDFFKADQIVQTGDTILISTSETMEDLGHSCFYNRKDIGLLGGEQLCLKPNREIIFDKFLYYATNYFHLELKQYATGLKVYRFKLDDLKKINIMIPPTIEEQRQIVSYLDEQTSRIDKLIADKTKIIEELESYKQSLIYEYVTGKKEV